jgi:hypothetical protein
MILGIMSGLLALTVLVVLLRSLWIRTGLNTRQTVMTIGVALLVIAVVALTLTGRLNWIVTALAAVIGLTRWSGGGARWALWIRALRGGPPNAAAAGSRPNARSSDGTTSTESPFFRMTLHHASGHMDGEIKQGRHKSRFLSELNFAELVSLISEVQDYDSRHLLESYLDHHYPDWRVNPNRAGESSSATMDRREALEALGLEDGASRDEIVAAHRRLIQRLHPDRGGSTYLAALLNRAKEILIDEH